MRALGVLIKPASGRCNLRCKYCFYADVTEIRDVRDRGVMSPDTLETIVKNALAESERYCSFGFQGGEPTLAGLEFFRALIRFEKQYNINRVKIEHSIQTNGMLIDEEWATFLAEHNFLTGLSLDAETAVHDALRVDAHGKGTHSRAMKAARLLSKANAPFNVLTVVTKPLAQHPDAAYRFYRRQKLDFLQFIPCLDGLREERGAHPYSLDAETYGRFLCRIFDLWYADFVAGQYVSIRAFDNYIHMLQGRPPENCAMNGVCNPYPLIEADGSVYPCDFYAVDDCLLGNVATHTFAEMLSSAAAEAFALPSREVDAACKTCEYHFICRGGCRRDRESLAEGRLSLNCYCAAYKRFFAHALPRMRQIAGRG